jgi:hypothetical protein
MSKSNDSERKLNICKLLESLEKIVCNIGDCTPPIEKEVLKMALDIKNKDSFIDYCDAVLVSHAILDRDAHYLLTFDNAIHRSNIIQEKINEREDDWIKFNLIDWF